MSADAALVVAPRLALAVDTLKVGVMLPSTGSFAPTGRQIEAACRVYVERNGPGSIRRATVGAQR